jgi:CRP-like cAMP-binding protein
MLCSSKIFANIPFKDLLELEKICKVEKYKDGDVICRANDKRLKIFIICQGNALEYYNYQDYFQVSRKLSACSSFGEEVAFYGHYGTTVVATSNKSIIEKASSERSSLQIASLFVDSIETCVISIDVNALSLILNEHMCSVWQYVNAKLVITREVFSITPRSSTTTDSFFTNEDSILSCKSSRSTRSPIPLQKAFFDSPPQSFNDDTISVKTSLSSSTICSYERRRTYQHGLIFENLEGSGKWLKTPSLNDGTDGSLTSRSEGDLSIYGFERW